MSVATIDTGASRAAIMAWRDEATLAAMALVHGAAAGAMRTLETGLDAITNAQALKNAEAVARAIVRPTMRDALGAAADRWFRGQAQLLRQVDVRAEAIALRFAALGERPLLPPDDAPPPAGWRAPAWLRGSFDAISETLDRGGDVASRALPDVLRQGTEQVTTRIGREIGERSGAYERVRAAGRAELTRVWLGPAPTESETRPYLSQLFDMVDRTARDARETLQ